LQVQRLSHSATEPQRYCFGELAYPGVILENSASYAKSF